MKIKRTVNRIVAALITVCMTFTMCCGELGHIPVSVTKVVSALTELSDNAIELEYGKNIRNIILSYLDGDNWIDITDNNSSDLPANANYRIEFFYDNISVEELIKSDYQMFYSNFPDWFSLSEPGVLLYDDEIAASMELVDGQIVITFDKAWVEKHSTSSSLSGSFTLSGMVDWRKLPDSDEDRRFPGIDIALLFEKDMAQKYGIVDIEKSEPVLVTGSDGKYYLEYELTVTSSEDFVMPDITVKDLFSNPGYINGYIGIDGGIGEPAELYPEEIVDDGASPGKLSKNGEGMLWEIGDLMPGEVRTLKYYAQISDSYVDSVISNPIQNRAAVFSKNYQKDDDASSFKPQNGIQMQKKAGDAVVDQKGNGQVSYTVTMSAPDDNSFVQNGLVFTDSFPEELKSFLSGDNGNMITVTVNGKEQSVPYSDGSFSLSGLSLAPGEQITITYTVFVRNIFLYNNGEVELNNTATVSKNDRILRSSFDNKTLQKVNSARKLYGNEIDSELDITIAQEDDVYEYSGDSIVRGDNPGSFTVGKGSHRYDVVLNESGSWDLSSTVLKDTFGDNNYIDYTGYVQIRLYEYNGENTGELSGDELVGELEASTEVRTVWLKVDDMDSFTFTPSQLGVEEGKNYTYLLTYYAKTKNLDNVGSVSVTNRFQMSGNVGIGNGDYWTIPGIDVSTGHVIQGGIKYDAEKISWYYEPAGSVYKTDAVTSGAYPLEGEDGFKEQYANGAIYWVIRLEGDIKSGSAGQYGKADPKLSGFCVKDSPSGSGFNRDAVVGVFLGPKSFDFTRYGSYEDFLDEKFPDGKPAKNTEEKLARLQGNSRNDQWFHSAPTLVNNPDYEWFASNTALNGLIFKREFNLGDDEAIYIVLRTFPSSLPTGTSATAIYENTLKINSGAGDVPINTATYTYQLKTTLFKECKGAYIFDKNTGKFTNCSNRSGNDWVIDNVVGAKNLDSSGTYAAWLLNVNWDGSMSGEAYVSDFLPEGMELEYVEVNNFGNQIAKDTVPPPTTGYIEALHGDPHWLELTRDNTARVNYNDKYPITTITYYNPETREILWHVNGLTNGGEYKKYEINFRIICRVDDPELLLNGAGKTYVNHAAVRDKETGECIEMEVADVTITRSIDKSLDEEALAKLGAVLNGNKIHGIVNRLPFKLELNPFGEDMSENGVVPALVDELSAGLMLIENSIRIEAGGADYTAFSYTVEKIGNRQTLIIKDLPNNTPITIRYEVRIDSPPNEPLSKISNIAYWAGNPPPGRPQVSDKVFEYTPNGKVFVNNDITIEIIKVDSASHSKRLQGAEFEIFKVDADGNMIGEVIARQTTDSYGQTIFISAVEGGNALFDFNTIYCIKEVSAPSGYKLNETNNANCRYFIIIDANTAPDIPDTGFELDVWYDSPNYSCVIENDKGTIGVNKVFINEDGEEYIPKTGSYRFGLFDSSKNWLETLTIEYTTKDQVTTVKYYLDNVPKSSPEFTKFEPTGKYYVYELDDSGAPIENGNLSDIGGISYQVFYGSDGVNEVYVNSTLNVSNHERLFPTLPSSGGIGINRYIFTGILLMLSALALTATQYVFPKKKRSDE